MASKAKVKSKAPKAIKVSNVDKAQKVSSTAKQKATKPKSGATTALKTAALGGAAGAVVAAGVGLYQAASSVVSSVKKAATVAGELLDPNQAIKIVEANNSGPAEELQFPLGRDADLTCWMHITAFKYIYDKNDIPGNRRILDSELSTQVKKLYTVKLPLPGDISTAFNANWSDYTSVWSKIVRASNVAEGQEFDVEQFKDRIAGLVGSGALDDATKVAMLSGFAGIMSGTGIGASAGNAINDALTYLKVAGGISINPMSQAKYTGHSINSHSFQFNLIPRNRNESVAAMKIIEKFEDSIHGEKSNELGGILMNYPDMFNIRFTGPKGEVIPGIIEIPDCHLVSVNINRSSGTPGFKITKDYNPINYILSVEFRESQNLIRDDLRFLRQSAEQAEALHSGKPIPSSWSPNELLKDIKPFDLPVTAAPTSESSATSTENTNAPPGTVSVSSDIRNTIATQTAQSTDALLKGLTHHYTTQGVSNPEIAATQEAIKILRNPNHKDNIAIRKNIGTALGKAGIDTKGDWALVNAAIDTALNSTAIRYENAILEHNKKQVPVSIIPGVNVTLDQKTIDNTKGAVRNVIAFSPVGRVVEGVSQTVRAGANYANENGWIDSNTHRTIVGNANVFGTKDLGTVLNEYNRGK